jgi:hypothetical protein
LGKEEIPGHVEKVERQRLLRKVAAWYHQAFQDDPKCREALAKYGLTDVGLFTDFRIGYCNGTLKETAPPRSVLRGLLRGAQVINGEDREFFEGCLVFPWFLEGDECGGMWGLSLETGEGKYLPGFMEGAYNFPALKRSRSLILTDSILKALYLYQCGFTDVIPLWGKEGLTQDHLRLFQRYGTKQAVMTFECEAVAKQLREEDVPVSTVALPEFPAEVKAIEEALRQAQAKSPAAAEALKGQDGKGYAETETGFSVQYGGRRYEVKGIEKAGVKLRATLKAYRKSEPKRFFLDSVDLYSNRSRLLFAKGACGYFGEKEEAVRQDLEKLVELSEAYKPKDMTAPKPPTMTEAEASEAFALLKDPNLLGRILEDFEVCGLAGEEANKVVGYLAAVSRKLDDPLAVLIQSRSAAGKSALQEAILRLVPPEDMEKYTRLTGQALFYKDESGLSHKLLAIEEEAGAREASYSIRNLQSSKYLSIATTEKDQISGKLKTVEYKVKGPVALMLTTTAVDMDFETQNRFITLTIDESKAMTERILDAQREGETLAGLKGRRERERLERLHQNAQRLLRPLAVVNPHAPRLAFPADSLRSRRDHKKYLGLIRVIAYLHQWQREIKTLDGDDSPTGGEKVQYVEVTPWDIEQANRLAGEVLGRTVDELSAPGRALLAAIREMVKAKGIQGGEARFTRRDIRTHAGWGDFQVKTHLGELVELEYLGVVTGRKGKEYLYELAEAQTGPRLAGLVGVG